MLGYNGNGIYKVKDRIKVINIKNVIFNKT